MAADAIEELRTARLILEPLRLDHAGEMIEVLADPSLYDFTGGDPPRLDQLEQRYRQQAAGGPGPHEIWWNWILRRLDDGRAAGFVQATVTDEGAEVAWLVGVESQGLGFGVEAAMAMVAWLTGQGIEPIVAHIHPHHVASQRIATAIGLRETGAFEDDGEAVWSSAVD